MLNLVRAILYESLLLVSKDVTCSLFIWIILLLTHFPEDVMCLSLSSSKVITYLK